MSIKDNIACIQKKIVSAAQRANRDPQSILLMPVTKTVAPEAIIEAISCGFAMIGENKVQEIQAKYSALEAFPHKTHLIGHLQTNKVKDVVGLVDCIQSLDSLRLAKKLQDRLAYEDKTIEALVQVNVSGEQSKSGVSPEEALALIKEVIQMDRITLRGLMTIGANVDDEKVIRQGFRQLAMLQQEAQQRFSHQADFSVLSMGMSGDMEIAIEEGATLVRVGSAIFGKRHYL